MAALVFRNLRGFDIVWVEAEEELSDPRVRFTEGVIVVEHARSRQATLDFERVGALVAHKLRERNVRR